MKNLKLVFLLFNSGQLFSKSAGIIIHGTWANGAVWHTPNGNFFKSVQRCAKESGIVDEVLSFTWSGKLSYQCQLEAAYKLKKLIEFYDWVVLIGHSHGATVGILATQLLAQQKMNAFKDYKIKKFFALGVPVDVKVCPEMKTVEKFYNLFSFGDVVQTVNGAHLRCFPEHERLVNLSVMISDMHPSHSQLHDEVIGKELLKIEDYFALRNLGNFNKFDFGRQPGKIQFFDQDLPVYSVQHDQQSLLELDKKAQWMINMAFFRKYKKDNERS